MPQPVRYSHLGQSWWMLLLRGVIAILFGIIAFSSPGAIVLILTTAFGVFVLIDGIFALWVGYRSGWWLLMLVGAIGLFAGILSLAFPHATALTLLFIIAGWAIVRGAAEIATAVDLRKVIPNEWSMILGGVLSVLFGVFLFANPTAGALSIVWVLGTFAVLTGILLIYAAFRMKNHPWDSI